jgi:aminoglycoside/choline kinase family phosphotransferase
MESKTDRKLKLENWLSNVCLDGYQIVAMPGDASFRHYYRITTPKASYVAMDAPPPENCQPFVAIAETLRGMGLQAPAVLESDIEHGFLLLTDLGDVTYLKALREQPVLADDLYQRALSALAVMQDCRTVPGHTLKPFGRDWMTREWAWHQEWFVEKWLALPMPQQPALHSCYEKLIESAEKQPQVFMHRDYHSANLMVLPNNVGILDFQDAFIGPLTYDPASLLRDCYIDWPTARVQKWLIDYANMLRERGVLNNVTNAEFQRWFDWMGLQRHIKALMTFARKFERDNERHYLQYVPRTLNYVIQVSRQYPELEALADFYANTVQPVIKDAKTLCVP